MSMRRAGGLLPVWVVVAGCFTGDSGSGGSAKLAIDRPGGAVVVDFNEDAAAFAYFIKAVDPEPEPFSRTLADGSCVLWEDSVGGGEATYADVGPSITLAYDSDEVDALYDADFEYYEYEFANAIEDETTFTITNAGGPDAPAGTIGTLRLPGAVSFDSTPAVVAGDPLDLEYTSNVGASEMQIVIADANFDVAYTCFAGDDGEFTVPASVTDDVGSDANYSIAPVGLRVAAMELDGEERDVVLAGVGAGEEFFGTPPNPPNPYEACYMFWDHYIDNPVTRGHRAYVAALVDDWTTGTLTFGTGADDAVGALLYDITFGSGVVATYTSTSGSATVVAPSNSLHEPVDVTIGTAPTWSLTAGSGGNTTGGTGYAYGFFNDGDDCFGFGDPDNCITGTGDITFMVGTTSMTIGESSIPGFGFSLGFCEDLSAFSGTFQERASQFARSHPALFEE